MANPEHLKILKQGVEVWNRWRVLHYDGIQPDLSDSDLYDINLEGAFLEKVNFERSNLSYSNLEEVKLNESALSEAYLRYANLDGAYLFKADLREANLSEATLRRADLRSSNLERAIIMGANFTDANLSDSDLTSVKVRGANFRKAKLNSTNFSKANPDEVQFNECDLSNASFTGSYLIKTNFTSANLLNVDFSGCYLSGTIFCMTDLSTCIGLETVEVGGPCAIDFHTLRSSRNLPKSFQLKIGLPENYINYLPDFFDENPIRMYPVFLSHSWQNKDFAGKLYEALIARGVQVWYDEKKMKPGDDIYESLSRGIEVYDKMILVCSRQSLTESWWVDREIDRILKKERDLQKGRGKRINLLIPIRIDDHIFEWEGAKGEEVRRYNIGDFRDWQDESKFQKALDKLIAALNVDRGEDAPQSFL